MSDDGAGLVPIGRFSALSRLSVVALRHYADVGVLITRLDPQEDPMTPAVHTRTEPEQVVLMRTGQVGIADLHPFISSAFAELVAEAAAHGLGVVPGAGFTRFHGRVDEVHSDTVDVCLSVAAEPGHPGTVTLPAVRVATAQVYDERAAYPHILACYDAVARWAGEHGHDLVEPAREVYREMVSDGGPRDHVEIVWPLGDPTD